MQKAAYTVNELMHEIGIGRSKLYAEIKAGRLHPRKIGKRTIFLTRDIEEYLEGLPASDGNPAPKQISD